MIVGESNIPFQSRNEEGQLSGPVAQFAEELAADSELSFTTQVLPWARIMSFQSRPNTMVVSMTRTQVREPHFLWVGKIISMPSVVWKRASDIRRFDNPSVGAERNSHKLERLKQSFGESNVVQFHDC